MDENKKKNVKKIILAAAIIVVAVVGFVSYYLFLPQFHPVKTAYVYIDRDDNVDSIYNKVKEAGHPGNMAGFRWLAKHNDLAHNIHTGKYAINKNDNTFFVYRRIAHGRQTPVDLAIGSVRTIDKLAKSISKQLMMDSAEISHQLLDSAFEAQLGYNKETVICLFIPETYQVYWDISVKDFIERMQKENKKFWTDERLQKAKAMGMTPEQVYTLASIVEEETNNNGEKSMVAGVYFNRMKHGMPLQADPTIKFALQNFELKRISNADTHVKSPYNTYTNLGLPPGPIRIPTVKGIDLTLNYVKHNYIYMCAKEDFSGTHNYAATFAEHMVNARKYWKALNDRKIYK